MLASWRFARNTLAGRRGRSALLIAATAIACSLVVAVSCCTGSAQKAMDATLKTILGPSDVRIIHQFAYRFDESLLDEVRQWEGVELATGRLFGSLTLVRADGATNPETGMPARVTPKAIGVSLENEQTFRDLEMREGRRLEGPGEILIDPLTAEQMQAKVGDILRVQRFGPAIGRLVQRVAELIGPHFGSEFFAPARIAGVVIASLGFFQLAEYVFQGLPAQGDLHLLGGHEVGVSGALLLNVTLVDEVLDEVGHAVLLVGQAVFLVELGQPGQRLAHIAGGVYEQFLKQLEQLFEQGSLILPGNEIGKAPADHNDGFTYR